MEENKPILLEKPKLPNDANEAMLYDMLEFVNKYLHTFHGGGENIEVVRHMREEIDKAVKLHEESFIQRADVIDKMLYQYWKVSTIDDKGKTTPVMYFFPYRLERINRMLFTLCSYIKPEYNGNNGLHEASYDIMDDLYFKNYDLLFEEATVDDMLSNAKQSCEDALNDRLWKLKYRDGVLE